MESCVCTRRKGIDLYEVRKALRDLMDDVNHDDGSYGPLFIRFSWHNAGTYSKELDNGGTNGCTMRFETEQNDPENNGLGKARELLEPLREKFPQISCADLYALAGTVAIEHMGGPRIKFSTGRVDFTEEEAVKIYGTSKCPFGDGELNPCRSRLPAADLGVDPIADEKDPLFRREAPTINAVRGTFERMGFNDKETVCLLLLGHQFGRCHPEVSGYEDAWYAFDPSSWNVYERGMGGYSAVVVAAGKEFKEITTEAGKRQWRSRFMGMRFMMLPSDMALLWDETYKEYCIYYDKHRLEFRLDAAKAWKKLIELGCRDLVEETTFDDVA